MAAKAAMPTMSTSVRPRVEKPALLTMRKTSPKAPPMSEPISAPVAGCGLECTAWVIIVLSGVHGHHFFGGDSGDPEPAAGARDSGPCSHSYT